MPDARTDQAYDVAVIGGGLVGASLACALSQLDLTTVVLEKVPTRAASQPSYDDRTLALSASSCNILKALRPVVPAGAKCNRNPADTGVGNERTRPGEA